MITRTQVDAVLASMPHLPDGEINIATVMGYSKAARYAPEKRRNETEVDDSVVRTVLIADLIPTQSLGVTAKIVKSYIFDRDSPDAKLPILVYVRDGKQYIEDGHHRVLAAIIRSDKSIKAYVRVFRKSKVKLSQEIRSCSKRLCLHATSSARHKQRE